MHRLRWTLEKISARLQFLSEAAIYRHSQPLALLQIPRRFSTLGGD